MNSYVIQNLEYRSATLHFVTFPLINMEPNILHPLCNKVQQLMTQRCINENIKHKWMRSSTLPQLSFKKSRGSWPSLILSFGFSFIPQISSYHRVFIIFALRSSYFLKAQFYRFGPSREYCNAGKSICLWILKLRRIKKPQIQLYWRSRGKILKRINGLNQNLAILPSNCNINCHGIREILYQNNLFPLTKSFLVKNTLVLCNIATHSSNIITSYHYQLKPSRHIT